MKNRIGLLTCVVALFVGGCGPVVTTAEYQNNQDRAEYIVNEWQIQNNIQLWGGSHPALVNGISRELDQNCRTN